MMDIHEAGQRVRMKRKIQPNGHGEPPPRIMKRRLAMTVSLSPSSLPEGERDDGSLREFHVNKQGRISL